jgi:membrane-associated protein
MIFSITILDLFFLFGVVFLASFAIPTFALLFIVSFVAGAVSVEEILIICFFALVACILGDLLTYALARTFSRKFETNLRHHPFVKNKEAQIEKLFEKNGSLLIFFSRFFMSGVGPYINYYAGFKKLDFKRFFWLVISGEIIYIALYSSLGYFFKDTWNIIIDLIEQYSVIVVVSILIIYFLRRFIKSIIIKRRNQNP